VKVVSQIMAVGAEFNKVLFSLFRLVLSHVPRSGSRDGVSSYGMCVVIFMLFMYKSLVSVVMVCWRISRYIVSCYGVCI
jgi:hypothetical protein